MEMVEWILLLQLESRNGWMDEVHGAFAISDIQSSPSCVRSSMIYGSETKSLLADVGLKFERAEMQMIRWMCGVSLKDRRQMKN